MHENELNFEIMNNGKLFDDHQHHRVKCPGMLTSKLSGLFGWRHTYRVHDRQKGINHFHNNNLQKTYSLNLPPKRFHETTSSNPSLPEASQSSSSSLSANTTVNDLEFNSLYNLEIPSIYLTDLRRLFISTTTSTS